MTTFDRIENWAYKIGLIEKSNPNKQIKKMEEEVGELKAALKSGDFGDIKEEIGDCFVVLNVMCSMLGLEPDVCTEVAVSKIEKRKGEMNDGFFVKK